MPKTTIFYSRFLSISRKHKFSIETTKVISLYSKFCVLSIVEYYFLLLLLLLLAVSHVRTVRHWVHHATVITIHHFQVGWDFRYENLGCWIYKPLLLCTCTFISIKKRRDSCTSTVAPKNAVPAPPRSQLGWSRDSVEMMAIAIYPPEKKKKDKKSYKCVCNLPTLLPWR